MAEELITRETFDHLVRLAALELDEQQAEYLRRELNHQLSAIKELEAIPLDDSVPVAARGVPYPPANRPPLRADEAHPYANPEDILANAPETTERYIIVPEIPHTTLE